MKRLLTLLSALMLCLPLLAQREASTTFGLDRQDARAVRQIRNRMAQIRKERPTVALVLSGGGAKGAATVGALKYMEQYDLPIDMVVGTSVGGLLGGLYAMGYDVDYLDTLIHTIDWDMALSDKVDRSFVPYSRIRYKEKYLLSFPFYYKSEDYQDYISGVMPFSPPHRGGRGGGGDAVETQLNSIVRENLLGSLPSGFVFGENVNHIISSRTVGYSDSTDFFKFPTPFACIATDIASGKAKVWHSGSVNLAMRSTMSIPGLFAPVRTGGMVLVDGGMRNNFPVNVARDMGADIVIGIDLSNDALTANRIQNLGDVISSSIDLMSNDAFESNVSNVDIRIHPDMTGYGMLSFNEVAIDSMFVRGYKAAQAQEHSLKALRKLLGNARFRRQNDRPAVDVGLTPVQVGEIEVVGVSEKEAEYIVSKMTIKAGNVVSRELVERDIAAIFGKGAFDYVNYEFRGTGEPYKLWIQCKRGPLHQFGFGARIDTKDLVSLLLNVGLNTNAMSGHSLDLTARVSLNPYVDVLYSYNAPRFSTMNARAVVRYTNSNNLLTGAIFQDAAGYNLSFLLATQELFFSNMHWSAFDVKLGVRNQYLKLNRVMSTDDMGDLSAESGDYPSAFIDARMETLDNGYFPTKGVSAGLRGDLVSHVFNPDSEGFFGIACADVMVPVTIGRRFTLMPQWYLRLILKDEGVRIPTLFSNIIGGDMRGRYVEQQFPFIGLSDATLVGNDLMLVRLDLRYQFATNHYATLVGNGFYDFNGLTNLGNGSVTWGVGAGYSYNTPAGPLKAQLFWSSLTKKVGAYLSFGYNF